MYAAYWKPETKYEDIRRAFTYATMTENLTDTRLAAKDCVSFGTFHGGHDPNEKADYYIGFVLCSDDFSVEAYRTVTKGFSGRFTSDHFPIYADMKFTTEE